MLSKTRVLLVNSLKYCQFGFLRNRSTIDAALLLDAVLKRKRGKAHVAFLDVKGAYDTVRREFLWERLRAIVPELYYKLIVDLFESNSLRTLRDNQLSNEFSQ